MGAATSADDRALLAQLWRVCEQLLHDPHYKTHYGNWLAQTLLTNGTKDQRILDTAAGVGFPAIQLCDHGFTSVSCSDADLDLLWSLKRNAGVFAPRIPTVCVRWQDLPTVIVDHFDTVLCLDASIGFMDSWGDVGMVSGPDSVCRRVRNVLSNFFQLTRPGGRFLVGLQKNNNRGNTEHYVMDVGTAVVDGYDATAVWDMRYDWALRRKTWINRVTYKGKTFEQVRNSYLFDKQDLIGFLTDIGFASVQEVATPDFFYEDAVMATKPET